jgi:hypothetical protein
VRGKGVCVKSASEGVRDMRKKSGKVIIRSSIKLMRNVFIYFINYIRIKAITDLIIADDGLDVSLSSTCSALTI